MIGLILDLTTYTIRAGVWVISSSYNGVNYLVNGSKEDKVMLRLDQLESKLNDLHDENLIENQKYYWNNKSKYINSNWVVICNQTLICQCSNKSQALVAIATHNEENPELKCLLIQVGQENNIFFL